MAAACGLRFRRREEPQHAISAPLVVQRNPLAIIQVPPTQVEDPPRMGDEPRALQHDPAERVVAPRLAGVLLSSSSSFTATIRRRPRTVQDQVDIAKHSGIKQRRARRAKEPPPAARLLCVSLPLRAGVEQRLEGGEGAPRVGVDALRVDGGCPRQGPGEQIAHIARDLPPRGSRCPLSRFGDLLPSDGAHAAQQGVADEGGPRGRVDVPAAQEGLVGRGQV